MLLTMTSHDQPPTNTTWGFSLRPGRVSVEAGALLRPHRAQVGGGVERLHRGVPQRVQEVEKVLGSNTSNQQQPVVMANG